MNHALKSIIDRLSIQQGDYSNFRSLISEIKKSELTISKDDVLELVDNDSRLQLHTTPNNLAQLISEISSYKSHSSGLDICCGTGNILYYLQNNIQDLTGIEINDNVAALTSYFIPDIKLITADTFEYPFTREYELITGNVPWGMPIRYKEATMKSEEAFIRKAFELCSPKGDLVFVVPYNLLVGANFIKFRKELRGNLKMILGLPKGVMRNLNVRTAILHFTKDSHEFVQVGLISSLNDLNISLRNHEFKELKCKNIEDRWDPEFLKSRTSTKQQEEISLQTKPLREMADIMLGRYIKAEELLDKGDFLYLKPIHIQDSKVVTGKEPKYVAKDQLNGGISNCIAQPGDIILSSIFQDLKLTIYKKGDPPAFISNNLIIIRSANDDYILSYLQSEQGREEFNNQTKGIRRGSVIPHISLKDLQEIRIPLLPISELNVLGNSTIERSTPEELQNYKTILTDLLNYKTNDNSNSYQVNEPDVIYHALNSLPLIPFFAFIMERLGRIERQMVKANNKLDLLLDKIKDFSDDFTHIKNLHRDDEEKLFQQYQSLDYKLDSLIENQDRAVDHYIEQVKRWLDLWELLDLDSQRFLPIAEFLYDKLNRFPEADYSPFIVQYCRTLENEILKKLFETYHTEGLKDVDRNSLVKEDLMNDKTKVFAAMVLKDDKRYELGKMSRIMSYLKEGGTTLKGSKLLKHFRNYTTAYFDIKILESEFLGDLDKIRDEFRNKAAHPHVLDLEMAKECKQLLRKNINLFLESKK